MLSELQVHSRFEKILTVFKKFILKLNEIPVLLEMFDIVFLVKYPSNLYIYQKFNKKENRYKYRHVSNKLYYD